MMRKFGNKNLVRAAILKAAFENSIQIHRIEVMPEHVHLLATLPKGMTDSKAFNLLKGRSAYLIFKNKKKFMFRYPRRHFWSAGGCAITVGYNSYDKTNNYLISQRNHHSSKHQH